MFCSQDGGDDARLVGTTRSFVLHYYLADDTMEILEVRRANAGRDPFPLFLKRGKVYKNLDSYLNIDAPTTHTTQLIDRTGRVDPKTIRPMPEKPNRTDPNTAHQVELRCSLQLSGAPSGTTLSAPLGDDAEAPFLSTRWTSTTTAPSPRTRCASTTRCTPQ